MQAAGKLATRGQPKKENSQEVSFLSDLEITDNESSRYQKAASVKMKNNVLLLKRIQSAKLRPKVKKPKKGK